MTAGIICSRAGILGVSLCELLSNFMDQQYITTKMENISESALADAIAETADVDQKEAVKLARMYFRFSDDTGDETLKEVLENLEVDAELEVLKNSEEK